MIITKKDLYFFNLALEFSKISECKAKHGCVITQKSKPLVIAVNIPKINCVKKKYRLKYDDDAEKRRKRQETTHAEIAAMLKIRKNSLKDTTLYSAHSLKNGECGNSYPCDACMQTILFHNIKYIVFWNESIQKLSTKQIISTILQKQTINKKINTKCNHQLIC